MDYDVLIIGAGLGGITHSLSHASASSVHVARSIIETMGLK